MTMKNIEICELCGKNLPVYTTADGKYVCKDCLIKAGYLPGKNLSYFPFSMFKNSFDRMEQFSETDRVGNMLSIDSVHHLWRCPINHDGCHDFKEIISWKIIEKTDVQKNGPTRWIGKIPGRGGEVCNSLRLQITLSGKEEITEYLNFVVATVNKSSRLYKDSYDLMHQCIAKLEGMKKVG